jgi:hypothetical protein
MKEIRDKEFFTDGFSPPRDCDLSPDEEEAAVQEADGCCNFQGCKYSNHNSTARL